MYTSDHAHLPWHGKAMTPDQSVSVITALENQPENQHQSSALPPVSPTCAQSRDGRLLS